MRYRFLLAAVLPALLPAVLQAPLVAAPTTIRVGSTLPLFANAGGEQSCISADGRHVAFVSNATNLAPGDLTGKNQVFVRETTTGHTVRVSVDATGAAGNAESERPSVNADVRYVAYSSKAGNLTGGPAGVLLWDRETGNSTRVDMGLDGAAPDGVSDSASISDDGRIVAFRSLATNLVPGDTNGVADIFVRDMLTAETRRVSVASDGTQADRAAAMPCVSGNGQFVAFSSAANNLVAGDTNAGADIFLHDVSTGDTIRVSVAPDGTQTNGESTYPAVNADGTVVAFLSKARNLVPDSLPYTSNLFVADLRAGTMQGKPMGTEAFYLNPPGATPRLSADGRYVAFISVKLNQPDGSGPYTYVQHWDRVTDAVTLVSTRAPGVFLYGIYDTPSISADGRRVTWVSWYDSVLAGDANGCTDVFLWDMSVSVAEPISLTPADANCAAPSVNADGRYVAFERATSGSAGPSDVYRYDRTTGKEYLVSRTVATGLPTQGSSWGAGISGDGATAVFTSDAPNLIDGDTNGKADVFTNGVSTTSHPSRIPPYSNGTGGRATISATGYVAFISEATNWTGADTNGVADAFTATVGSSTITRVSVSSAGAQANGPSTDAAVSFDGKYVAFTSSASNLVADDTNSASDVFLRDVTAKTTVRVSVGSDGSQGNGDSGTAGIAVSAYGARVAFSSTVDNLVPGDANGQADVFVRDVASGTTTRVSVAADGGDANGASDRPALSADGRYVAFRSYASNLVADDTNGVSDVFLRDLLTGVTTRVSVGADGSEANGDSDRPSISADGRYVAFDSIATNLAGDPTPAPRSVYLRGPLDVTPGVYRLGYATQPAGAAVTLPLTTQPVMEALDAAGNRVTSFTGPVTLTLSSQIQGALQGTSTVSCVAGVATFTDLSVTIPGNFFLTATTPGATSAPSDTFGVPDRLIFNQPPYGAIQGQPLTPTPRVDALWSPSIYDRVTNYQGRVTIALLPGTGTPGARLSGETTLQASAEFYFRDVSIDLPGKGYVLTASAEGLPTVQTAPFDVVPPTAGETVRASVSSDEIQATADSRSPSINANGRYVAFQSAAADLVSGDTNSGMDVFLRDIAVGDTIRISVSSGGDQANGDSTQPLVSPDARFVAFTSAATNLHGADTESRKDVFVRDLLNGVTECITADMADDADHDSPFVNQDGRFVAFVRRPASGASSSVWMRDRSTGALTQISVNAGGYPANMSAERPSVSADGSRIVFTSTAGNLVVGGVPGRPDVYLRDLRTGVTSLVPKSNSGVVADNASQRGSISSDGRYVVFTSEADNLVPGYSSSYTAVYVRDLDAGTTVWCGSTQAMSSDTVPSISATGRYVAHRSWDNTVFPGPLGGQTIKVLDTTSGEVIWLPPVLQTVTFQSSSESPVLSADGRFVAFDSTAGNLVPDDTNGRYDVFRRRLVWSSSPTPFTLAEVRQALVLASGTGEATGADLTRLDAVPGNGINLHDAVAIARKVAGVDK